MVYGMPCANSITSPRPPPRRVDHATTRRASSWSPLPTFVCVRYLHSRGVVHRDIKPRNLLVNSNCDLQICDFGLSRMASVTAATHPWGQPGRRRDHRGGGPAVPEAAASPTTSTSCSSSTTTAAAEEDESDEIATMTQYVATRWYRAPEVLVGFPLYDYAVDIWATGKLYAPAAFLVDDVLAVSLRLPFRNRTLILRYP